VTEPPYLSEYQAGYIHPGIASSPLSELTPRAKALREAEKLVTGDRNKSYGSPVQNFQNTADLWNTQFRHMLKDDAEFTAAHVAQAMVLLKMARMIAGKKRDNWIDVIGYAGCGVECDEA
jgi:hypothetical protein